MVRCMTYNLSELGKLRGVLQHVECLLSRPGKLLGHGVDQAGALCIALGELFRMLDCRPDTTLVESSSRFIISLEAEGLDSCGRFIHLTV